MKFLDTILEMMNIFLTYPPSKFKAILVIKLLSAILVIKLLSNL